MLRFLCFFLLVIPGFLRAQPHDLLIVAGQSNAVGYDAYVKDFVPMFGDQDVRFWYRCGDPPPDKHDVQSGAWTFLRPQPKGTPMAKGTMSRQYGNYSHRSGGFGPEVGLARTLQAKNPRPIAIIKVAWSGTRIDEWQASGSCYQALTNELSRATGAAAELNIELRPRAFVWVQGESDATSTLAPKYAERLTSLIQNLRRDTKTPKLIALVGVNERFGGGRKKQMPDIIRAQQNVADAIPLCSRVDTSKASIANGAHWNGKGTLDAGRWFAEALLKLEGAESAE